MTISVVDYEPKFKPQILKLFKKTFKKEMSEKYWNWRFENNPFGKSIIKLAFNDQQLIGNYIVNPTLLIYGKKTIPVLHSMTTMTDLNYRGLGISSNLANHVYEKGKELGFKAIIGFANNQSHYMFTKKLGFYDLKTMNELKINYINHNMSNLSIKEISDFHELPIDFSPNTTSSKNQFMIKRNPDLLNWRYMLNPENKYYCFKIIDESNFYGYFVLKFFDDTKCHIIDFLLQDTIECHKLMISFSLSFSKKFKVDQLTMWENHKKFKNLFNQESICFIPQKSFFIVKLLDESYTDLLKIKNWYITMSDSDVF